MHDNDADDVVVVVVDDDEDDEYTHTWTYNHKK